MTSMLLATSAWNYVLIAVVVLLLIALPIMMNARNKKETQKVQEQTNSLKVGDKVLTTSGVYGTITEVKFDDSKKTVVIETGGKVKSYLTVDAYAIYTVFKSDAELKREAEAKAAEQQRKIEEEQAKRGKKGKNKDLQETSTEQPKVEEVAEAEGATTETSNEPVTTKETTSNTKKSTTSKKTSSKK